MIENQDLKPQGTTQFFGAIRADQLRLPLLGINILTLIVMFILLFGVYLRNTATYRFEIPFVIGAVILLLLSIVLLLNNRIRVAAVIFIFIFFLAANLFGWVGDGIDDPTVIVFFAVLIPFGGLYLGRQGTIIMTVLVILSVFSLYIGGLYNFLGQPRQTIDIPTIVSVGFIVLAITYEFTYRQLTLAAEDLWTEQSRLEQRNEELTELSTTLEGRIEERTRSADRRARLIEAAADVGRAATSIYSLEELLPQVTRFISERFDFYHVGIFLLDELGQNAILRASSSEGGRRIMARGLRLRVGQEGLVGHVTGTGEARIASDIESDSDFMDVPELPDTRSELVLPLFSGGQMLGALDVQSRESFAFDDEDLNALRVLADQVSMAINNAMLFEQLQSSLEAERKAYGVVSRQAWQEMLKSSPSHGYLFRNNRLNRVQGEWSATMIAAASSAETTLEQERGRPTLAIPIRAGEDVIGVMRLQKAEGSLGWSANEIDLAETLSARLSEALDSARLFQETQRTAAYQQLTSEISTQMRETLDIDSVLRTAAQELGEAFKAKEVVIRLNNQRR
jgi:GAF domain-containing protein